MNPDPEIDPDTYDFDSFAELRGWRASHSRLVELSTPAEGVAFDAAALAHAAWCLNPRSKPLRQALDLLVSSLHDSRPFRLLSPDEQAWAKRLMHDEWEGTE